MQENREEITDAHTFKPLINEPGAISKEKFEERLLENLRKKRENLIKLQEKIEENLSFQRKSIENLKKSCFLRKMKKKALLLKEIPRKMKKNGLFSRKS